VDPTWEGGAEQSEGVYVLQTNILEWTPEALWKTYIQLTEAEAAFRIHKSDLSLRPIWHQRADRVQAHILVCFLAYVLWKTLEQWQARARLGNSPRFLLDQLREIQSVDVALPLADDPHKEVKIRCVVRPEPAQAMLLDRLGVRPPERLRIPAACAENVVPTLELMSTEFLGKRQLSAESKAFVSAGVEALRDEFREDGVAVASQQKMREGISERQRGDHL